MDFPMSHEKIIITARIERRSFYADGKYLGSQSPFTADNGETARDLTGNFFGEWEGSRYFDGSAIVAADIERAINDRRLLLQNHPGAALGEVHNHPIKLGDWGEYRVITSACLPIVARQTYEFYAEQP
mgnify:CR=1 FL=1